VNDHHQHGAACSAIRLLRVLRLLGSVRSWLCFALSLRASVCQSGRRSCRGREGINRSSKRHGLNNVDSSKGTCQRLLARLNHRKLPAIVAPSRRRPGGSMAWEGWTTLWLRGLGNTACEHGEQLVEHADAVPGGTVVRIRPPWWSSLITHDLYHCHVCGTISRAFE